MPKRGVSEVVANKLPAVGISGGLECCLGRTEMIVTSKSGGLLVLVSLMP